MAVLEEEQRRIQVPVDRRGRSIRGTCQPSGCTCRSFQSHFDQQVLQEVPAVEVAVAAAVVVVEEGVAVGRAWVEEAGYVQGVFLPLRRATAAAEEEMHGRAVQEVHWGLLVWV